MLTHHPLDFLIYWYFSLSDKSSDIPGVVWSRWDESNHNNKDLRPVTAGGCRTLRENHDFKQQFREELYMPLSWLQIDLPAKRASNPA